ncbi:MAG: c-type cytochrome domain-containing protein [Verrucomicrobiota bacterium JB023]|nr:c-type cytochrome domain-containing protein [Verrucomicrobiota bacterium JB023]
MKKIASVFFGSVVILASCGGGNKSETRLKGPPVLSPELLAETKTRIDFVRHVKPILEHRCVWCHNGKDKKMPYVMTNRSEAFAGGRIVPGRPDESLLFRAMSAEHEAITMPAVGFKVPKEEVEVVRKWIEIGATWPAGKAGELRGK